MSGFLNISSILRGTFSFLIICFNATSSVASDSLNVNMFVIKTDLIAIPVPIYFAHEHYFSLTFEKNLCKKQSCQLQFFYDWYDSGFRVYHDVEITPQYKYYFSKLGSGFFSGLYSKFTLYKEWFYDKYDEHYILQSPHSKLIIEYERQSIAGGIIAGYQRIFKKHWVAEFIIGYGIKGNINEKTLFGPSGHIIDKTHRDAVVSMNVGYRF